MANIKLPGNLAEFNTLRMSNSEEYNFLLSTLKRDINAVYSDIGSLNNKIDSYILQFEKERVDKFAYQTNRLINRYNSYKNLAEADNFNLTLSYGFDDETGRFYRQEGNYLSDFLFSDPKDRESIFPRTKELNIKAGMLELPVKTNDNIGITSYYINTDQSSNYYAGDFYSIKQSPEAVTLEVVIELADSTGINTLAFNSESFFPFNIKTVSKFSGGTFTPISGVTKVNVFSSVKLFFPSVTTNKIKIEIELTKSRGTNQTINYSVQDYIKSLLDDSSKYNSLEAYNSLLGRVYAYYIFHFNINSISAGKTATEDSGIFVSNQTKISEPSNFQLKVESIGNNTDIETEYYLYKADYNTEGLRYNDSEVVIPILPLGTGTVRDVLVFDSNKIARLNFTAHSDTLSVYCGDTIIARDDDYSLTLDGRHIQLFTELSSSIYYAAYTPNYKTLEYPYPVFFPDKICSKSAEIFLSNGIVTPFKAIDISTGLQIDTTGGTLFRGTFTSNNYDPFLVKINRDAYTWQWKRTSDLEYSAAIDIEPIKRTGLIYLSDGISIDKQILAYNSGTDKVVRSVNNVKIHLPYLFKSNYYQERRIQGVTDSNLPNTPVVLTGREAVLEFDTYLYPKLDGCSIYFSGELEGYSLEDDETSGEQISTLTGTTWSSSAGKITFTRTDHRLPIGSDINYTLLRDNKTLMIGEGTILSTGYGKDAFKVDTDITDTSSGTAEISIVTGINRNDTLYYYNSDNSVLVNWNNFSSISDYSHSMVSLIVIMRKINSTGESFALDNAYLMYNNFNKMLNTVSNIVI